MNSKYTILLVHGFAKSKKDMTYLETQLIKLNYTCININFPLTFKPIENSFKLLKDKILTLKDKHKKIILIGHSTGCIVIRKVLENTFITNNIYCCILISPPSKGSLLADIACKYTPLGYYCKTLNGITTLGIKKLNLKSNFNIPIGIIMGSDSSLFLGKLFYKEPNDGRVSINSALQGCYYKDFLILPLNHKKLHYSEKIVKEINFFIHNHYFKK